MSSEMGEQCSKTLGLLAYESEWLTNLVAAQLVKVAVFTIWKFQLKYPEKQKENPIAYEAINNRYSDDQDDGIPEVEEFSDIETNFGCKYLPPIHEESFPTYEGSIPIYEVPLNVSYFGDCDSPKNNPNIQQTTRKNRYAFGNRFHERDIINTTKKMKPKRNTRPSKQEKPSWDLYS